MVSIQSAWSWIHQIHSRLCSEERGQAVSCTREVNPASSSMAFLWETDMFNTQMGYDLLQYYAHINSTGDERGAGDSLMEYETNKNAERVER